MVSDRPVILAFDTAAAHCAAALVRGDDVLARRDEEMVRGQAERLIPMIEEMLAETALGWDALHGIGCCTGPGNFTGLRLSVAAARGIALALDVPSAGVTLFEALAAGRAGPTLVTLRDPRGGVFAQTFRDGLPASPPSAGALAELGPFDPRTTCIGFEAARIAAELGLSAGPDTTRADTAVLARLAAQRFGGPPPAPLYLRPADAMPPAEAPPVILDDA